MVLVCWMISTVASVLIVRRLAPLYKSEALVLVDSQKIPEAFVSSTVEGELPDRLALISQSIMSRTHLLEIIQRFQLYKKERASKTEDEIVQKMRGDISIKVEHSWTGGKMAAFRLGYQGRNPQLVADVTNRLAGLYAAENLRSREDQAEGTVQFLDEQLNQAKQSLTEQEEKVSEFKRLHNGELPEQENSLLGKVGSLRVQLQGTQDALNRFQDDKMMLETSLSGAQALEAAQRATSRARLRGVGSESLSSGDPTASRSEILQAKLNDLRLRYTPDHPDVQAVERELEEAKQQEQQQTSILLKSAKLNSEGLQNGSVIEEPPTVNLELLEGRQRIAALRTQLAGIKRNIDLQTKQREALITQIAASESRINELPLIEQQMAALTRDYQISQSNYKSLLDKKLAAGIATDMEHSKKSERFEVIDPAKRAEKPFKPNRIVLSAIGSLAGLAIGLALGLGLEFRTSYLLGEWELPPDIVILGRVPMIGEVAGPSKKGLLRRIAPICLCLVASGLLQRVGGGY